MSKFFVEFDMLLKETWLVEVEANNMDQAIEKFYEDPSVYIDQDESEMIDLIVYDTEIKDIDDETAEVLN